MADIEKIKQLRQETGISVQECKKALEEAADLEEAKKILKKKGKKLAQKKSGREAEQGIIESYIHSNKKVGSLIKLRCESDFVAKSKEFQKLAHELCMQIAASKPLFLKPDDIPEKFLAGEREIYEKQVEGLEKPKKVINEIVEGKLEKYKKEISLLTQPWIRDEEKTIKELINEYIAKLGENIVIEDFKRFEI